MNRLVAVCLLGLGLASCGPKPLVSELTELKEGWALQDSLEVEFEVAETTQEFDFELLIRNTDDYPYKNLFVYIDYTFPDRTVSDTVSVLLADHYGAWLGSGIGAVHTSQIKFKRNASFPVVGNYSARITHGMRDTLLPGISEFGFEIIPSEK